MCEDKRSKRFALVPFCLLSQAFQAQGIVKHEWSSTIKPIVQKLIDNDINIIQMPCPESSFGGYGKSLVRKPLNIEGYENEEYRAHCQKLCDYVIDMIVPMLNNGYKILTIMSINKSPSCSNGFVHTDEGGLIEKKGIFFDELTKRLKEKNIDIPIIGINKKDITEAMQMLDELILCDEKKI